MHLAPPVPPPRQHTSPEEHSDEFAHASGSPTHAPASEHVGDGPPERQQTCAPGVQVVEPHATGAIVPDSVLASPTAASPLLERLAESI